MFNIGDKVKIKDDLHYNEKYDGMEFLEDMINKEFEYVTITSKKTGSKGYTLYKIYEDGGDYWYTNPMFEKIENDELRAFKVSYNTQTNWNRKLNVILHKGELTLDCLIKKLKHSENCDIIKCEFWEVPLSSIKLGDISVEDYLKYLK